MDGVDRRTWGLEEGLGEAELAEIERSIRDAQAFLDSGRGHRVEVTRDADGNAIGWDWPSGRTGDPDTGECGERLYSDPARFCRNRAGIGTQHVGSGPCAKHERRVGPGVGAWIVAHAFARQLDVTPWEGLLTAVRIAAGRVAFIEHKLARVESDRQLEPPNNDEYAGEAARDEDHGGTNLNYWVKQAEVWHDKLARISKLAIDAGVAERLVRQLELEAQLMLRATSLTLDELGLDGDTRQRALGIMSRNLLALEAEESGQVRESEHDRQVQRE